MTNQPKKYNKFIATAATATLVASAIVPVASAASSFTDVTEGEYTPFIEQAVEAGLMKGYNDTTFGFTDSVKRSQVVIVMGRLLEKSGIEADADYASNKAFSDVSSSNDELLKYSNIVKKSGVFTGYTDGTLDPNAPINRENMAAVFNRAAKAITGTTLVEAAENVDDKKVADLNTALSANQPAIQALVDLGISTAENFNPKGDVQRRHFAKFAVTAVQVVESLKEKQVELAVKSVKTIDAETIEITLSDAIKAEKSTLSAIKASYVKEKETTSTDIPVDAKLSEDGKTITLTTKTATSATDLGFEGKTVTVKVPFEALATEKGKFIAPGNFTTEFASVAPTFKTVEGSLDADGKTKELTLQFDKKLQGIEAIKIGTEVLDFTIDGKTVTAKLSETAKALEAGTYEVTVINAKDFAGNVTTTAKQTATLVKDETAPEVVSINQVEGKENVVEVELSEALKTTLTTDDVTATVGTFTKNAVESITVDAKDAKKYTVTLKADQLVAASSSDVKFTFGKEKLVDKANNKNKEAVEVSTSVVLDKKLADAAIKVEKNAVELTFAEDVDVKKALADLEVTSSKGEILTGSDIFAAIETKNVTDSKEKVVTLTAKSGAKDGQYTVVLPEGFVVDKSLSANKMAKTTVNVTIGEVKDEEKVETEFAVASAKAVANEITVDFGTKVAASSALDLSNYAVAGNTLTADTAKIAFAKNGSTVDQTKVVITLADNTIDATDAKALFTIAAGIQAVNEKASKAFTSTVAVTENVAPEFKSVVATDINELTFTFSEDVKVTSATSVNDEVKLFDKDGKEVAFSTAKVDEGKLVLDLGEVKAASVVAYEIVKVEKADLTDVVGNAVKALAKTTR